MAAAPGGRTSSGAFAGRPRPPARHFQFCLPLRPRPRRAPGSAGPSRAALASIPGSDRSPAAPRPGLSRPGFVCSLTGDRNPPGCGVSPAPRGVRVASPTLDALPGGEDAAGSRRGRPGQCAPCLLPGAQRVRAVARTFGQGWGTCGASSPGAQTAGVRTRGCPWRRRSPRTRRGDPWRRGLLCPAVVWGSFSPQLAGEPRPRRPSQAVLLSALKPQRHREPPRERPAPTAPTCLAPPGVRERGGGAR